MSVGCVVVTLFFIYGLAFFTLGLLLWLTRAPQSLAPIARSLRLLGLFGLTHGCLEWLIMAEIAGALPPTLWANAAQAGLGGLSFLILLAAGLEAMTVVRPIGRGLRTALTAAVGAVWAGFLAAAIGEWASFEAADKISRWVAGAPGAFLMAAGLIAFRRTEKDGPRVKAHDRLWATFQIAAAALGAYGLLTLPGGPGDFFPASIVNAPAVGEILGFPIQVLRAIAAAVLAAAVVGALREFDRIEREELERLVDERTARLTSVSENLTEALVEAERANRAKSEFLASMSHELRTPLNAILGFSRLMNMEMFGPLGAEKYREYTADINASGEHLLGLIDQVLDLSKIEAGKREYSFEALDVNEIVDEAVRHLRPIADEQRVTLCFEAAEGGPQLVADRRAVAQILLNLISNAIKYNEIGGAVRVAARRAGNRLLLTVEDDGVGIPAAELPTITQPFVQVRLDPYVTRSGSGLGLSVVEMLAREHEGDLRIESEAGRGTCVTVDLPVAGPGGGQPPAGDPGGGQPPAGGPTAAHLTPSPGPRGGSAVGVLRLEAGRFEEDVGLSIDGEQ
ncbi:MAG: ATP-binding protein [Alphaproteobacteria bacterium]|nr:ATP-binding protein [Alphaproteobacteria bacterium]